MKEEYLKTYAWMNTLRGGVLRDVYALIYQLEHDARRKGTVKISIGYISERLGYSSRSVQYAIAELKEKGWLNMEYGDGKRSVYKAMTPANLAPHTPANSAPPEKANNPRKVCTPANSAPLQDLHPTHANLAPLTPYISKDNRIDYSSSSSPACARERLQKWFEESDIKQWANMLVSRSNLNLTTASLLDEFYDNDFEVRENCEQSRRMEALKHFQNWLPKYLNKLKNQNNGNNRTSTPPTTGNGGQRTINLGGIAQSILAGCEAGRASRQ